MPEEKMDKASDNSDAEKVVFMNKDSIMLNLTAGSAESILCQTMFDETLRLRKCIWKKERDSIRKFLIETFQIMTANTLDTRNQAMHQSDKQQ